VFAAVYQVGLDVGVSPQDAAEGTRTRLSDPVFMAAYNARMSGDMAGLRSTADAVFYASAASAAGFTEHEAVVFSTFALGAPGGVWTAAFLEPYRDAWRAALAEGQNPDAPQTLDNVLNTVGAVNGMRPTASTAQAVDPFGFLDDTTPSWWP